MSEQDLLDRIAKLETENALLRGLVDRKKRRRLTWPYLLDEVLSEQDISHISNTVRRICFNQVIKERWNGRKYVTKIDLLDMNDEQYENYLTIMDEVITILRKYAVPHSRRDRKEGAV